MNREHHALLNYLDQPLRLLFLTVDEVLVLLVPLMLGFWFMWAFTGLVGAVAGFLGLRFFKKRFGQDALRPALYWHLPTSHKHMKLYVPSSIREYVG